METLIGVLLGGIIGVVASFVPKWWERRQAKLVAQATLAAYIKGVLDITKARGHVATGEQLVEIWEKSNPNYRVTFYGHDPDPVLPHVISSLGNLGPKDAALASVFLNILYAVRLDLREMSDNSGFYDRPVEQRIERVKWDLEQWKRAEEIGRELIARFGG